MVERQRRKKNKVRGERTHGKGDTKNNRGAGCRGGRGRAGANKGKFASIGRLDPRKYRLKAKDKGKAISIGQLDAKLELLVTKGKVLMEKDAYIIDNKSGFEKLLGQGSTNKKLIVKIKASKTAVEKIKASKGKYEAGKSDDDNFDAEFEAEKDSK